ncbi:hypothetical protein M3Y96_00193300 [Aphelenchoides besseyi]|nr:hypothetical protein M3Y96_00193300 [Aphelenchoides besseyi]
MVGMEKRIRCSSKFGPFGSILCQFQLRLVEQRSETEEIKLNEKLVPAAHIRLFYETNQNLRIGIQLVDFGGRKSIGCKLQFTMQDQNARLLYGNKESENWKFDEENDHWTAEVPRNLMEDFLEHYKKVYALFKIFVDESVNEYALSNPYSAIQPFIYLTPPYIFIVPNVAESVYLPFGMNFGENEFVLRYFSRSDIPSPHFELWVHKFGAERTLELELRWRLMNSKGQVKFYKKMFVVMDRCQCLSSAAPGCECQNVRRSKAHFIISTEQLLEFAGGLPLLLLLNIQHGKAETLQTQNEDPDVFAIEPVQRFILSYFTYLTQQATCQADPQGERMDTESESIKSTDPVSHSPEKSLTLSSQVSNRAAEIPFETVKEETGRHFPESGLQSGCSSYVHFTETAIDWNAETDEASETKCLLNDSIGSLILEANMRDENNSIAGCSDSSVHSSEVRSVEKRASQPLQRAPVKRKLSDHSNEESIQHSERLTIVADGQEFEVEKRLLIEESKVFAKRLTQNDSIDGFEINAVSKETMASVIKWMLKKPIKNLESQAQNLYVAADILGISRLKKQCVESLIRTCRGEDLASHFIFAVKHGIVDLLHEMRFLSFDVNQLFVLLKSEEIKWLYRTDVDLMDKVIQQLGWW